MLFSCNFILYKNQKGFLMNSKLCLSTYLSVLKIYKCSQDSGQLKILNGLVKCLYNNPEPLNAPIVSHIIAGERNLPRTIRDELQKNNYQHPRYIENFKRYVEYLLDPNKIVDIYKVLRYIAIYDNSIANDCIIDPISHTRKDNLDYNGNYLDFIAGVFQYVAQLKNDKTTEFALMITKEFCDNAILEFSKLMNDSKLISQTIVMDSDIQSQAKAFCRKYEESINLLPLCQIANIVNPTHNHVNKMYSDYCDCSDELKKQIMKEIDCPMIEVDDKYTLYHLLRRFEDDIEKMELASRDKTYMFSQYVIKSLEYEGLEPIDCNPVIFPVAHTNLLPNHTKSFLSQFINDYIYYKDKDFNISLPVPFNWMYNNLSFIDCKEKDLIFWLNLFIVSSCYDIQAYFRYENKESLYIPSIDDVKTIEDLFFLSLLLLYDTYLNK